MSLKICELISKVENEKEKFTASKRLRHKFKAGAGSSFFP
jgi:hypothetical protein